MRRREFIGLVGGAAAWPLAARAQQRAMPVIGFLSSGTPAVYAPRVAAFRQGLREAGFIEGQNVEIEFRWANNQYDRLPDLAGELVRARVAMIAAVGNNLPARAAKAATSTIPIVFAMGADPVRLGLVASLNRPGGNITGATTLAGDIIPKRLQLLHDLLPSAKVFGCLFNSENIGRLSDGRTAVDAVQDSARALGATLHLAPVRSVEDFDAAYADLVQKGIEAAFTTADALFNTAPPLVELAAQHRLPMIFHATEASKAGGLMSYAASADEALRHAGRYAGRILKGEKPADLPALLPTKFEFVINLRTAKSLGLTIPPGLLAIVDEVIE